MEIGSGGSGSSRAGGGGGAGGEDQLHGLKFGKKIYFEDATAGAGGSGSGSGGGGGSGSVSAPSPSSSKAAAVGASGSGGGGGGGKKAKAVAGGGGAPPPAPPRCQVEGCDVDLSGAKAYYCRHKVCGMHSKAPRVVVAGLEQRFCQQCSRFHLLPEFDQGKRSCRRRLAGHNERRRKAPPGPLASRYGRLAASLGGSNRSSHLVYILCALLMTSGDVFLAILDAEEPGKFRSYVLDFSYPRVPSSVRDAWPAVRPGDRIAGGIQWHGSLDPHAHPGAVAGYGAHAYGGSQGSSGSGPPPPPLYPGPELPPGGCLAGVGVAADSSCALSLLSTQPWDTTTHRATASHNRAATMSTTTSFDANPVAPSAMASSYMAAPSPWTGSRGHDGGDRSVPHQLPHGVSLDEVHPGHGHSHHAQFSGELELALQGNTSAPALHIDHGHGSSSNFGQASSNTTNWSL